MEKEKILKELEELGYTEQKKKQVLALMQASKIINENKNEEEGEVKVC